MVKNYMVAIEELLAKEVIRRGKLLSGTDIGATRIVIEKICSACCGGKWEFGTYFFIDDQINVYLNFDDISTNEKVAEKYTFTKRQIEDFVFKYIDNIPERKVIQDEYLEKPKKVKKQSNSQIEQISLF